MTMIPWMKRREARRKAEEYLRDCCAHLVLPQKEFSRDAQEWIARRRWSKDPQELRRAVYYAVLSTKGDEVRAAHFPCNVLSDHEAHTDVQFEEMALEEIVGQKIAHFFERVGMLEVSTLYRAVMDQVERALLRSCLQWSGGNKLKAARMLGMNRNTLARKLRELRIATR